MAQKSTTVMGSVFIVGADRAVVDTFKKEGFQIAETEEESDAVVFTGGSDIFPFIYGERPLKGCYYNVKRDLEEIKLLKTLPSGLPKIGICRGGQLLNLFCGGSMFQDVDNHKSGVHPVKDLVTQNIIELNTVHHQMMIPGDQAFVVACARAASYKHSESARISYTDKGREAWDDPEVLFYPGFNALCFQAHPENSHEETRKYFFDLLDIYYPKP